VAGTVGGFGLNADGTTFTGDYSNLIPKSLLNAIKVFGCAGSTNVTSKALD
jgi:hypothetical protein